MRILVVEDEHKIANAIAAGLRQHNYAVDVCFNGDDGLAMATTEPYDLLILDVMMPGSVDGIGIVRNLREQSNHVPILLLTAKDKVLDRAFGLNTGADDYLVKPFAFVELIARVRALMRRPKQALESVLRYADVELDTQNYIVTRAGLVIELTQKEFSLLEYFMRHPDMVVSKEILMQHVWNYDSDILPNTVEVYVGYVRNKLDKPFKKSPALLHTKRGFGYIFGEKD
ncbi:DNA-binding response regulator [bacterium]|nr:DNA-binding response regulator [bacterium]NBX98621.1 DNA-binding response regulator [bacterium]NDC94243.1 DNA-binding response regulator [bacterium]NDD84010.1 DNA-binding response regulator [bacterium]NDG29454.1 DNA-binding response regulator [bacterium]